MTPAISYLGDFRYSDLYISLLLLGKKSRRFLGPLIITEVLGFVHKYCFLGSHRISDLGSCSNSSFYLKSFQSLAPEIKVGIPHLLGSFRRVFAVVKTPHHMELIGGFLGC